MRSLPKIGLVLAFVLALSVSALAAVAAPHAGRWTIPGGGGFTVSKGQRSISGLHLAGSSCGLGKVTVLGTATLRLINGGSNWIVGFNDPKRTNPNDRSGVVGQRVMIRSGSKTVHARLDIVFGVGGGRQNDGDLMIAGCDVLFFAHP